jgi:hypothetical protein
MKHTSTNAALISRAKTRKKTFLNQTQRLGEPACDPATLQAGITWLSDRKVVKLASRHSERDEHRHVIEVRGHFPRGGFGPMYGSATILPEPGPGHFGGSGVTQQIE